MRTFSLLTLAATAMAALDPIEVIDNKFFFKSNGSQFYIRGVAYQKDTSGLDTTDKFVDPLADEEACKRDIPYLQDLNTNVVRVYALNSSESHDACMNALADAGIYVIADLSSPDESIITTDPSWTLDLYDRYTSVIDEMQQYDNVLGFFAGNEVVTNSSNTDAAPFIKAAIRDMKAYISDNSYRDIPIGYSANDDSNTRVKSADYFACGDSDVKADFYGINMYEWCGTKTFKTSGYQDRTKEFSNLTIPVFFSEYGCNEVQPRKFQDVETLFSSEMTDVWSGGIVYMYFEEDNNYGLVSIDGDKVSTEVDYEYYSSEINAISPTSASASKASATAEAFSCPATNKYWKAATDLPPTPDEDVCKCLQSTLACVVSDDIDSEDYGDLFGTICGMIDCSAISADGESGSYGGFSFCSAKEKLSYLLNDYYNSQGSESSACDFSGSATLASTAADASGTCSSLISAASAGNSVSKSKTKTGSSSGSDSTGSADASSASASSSSTSSAAAAPFAAPAKVGTFQACFLPVVAVMCAGVASVLML